MLVLALLAWSWFARPIYELCWVVMRRIAEQVSLRTAPATTTAPRDQVIERMVEQGREIDEYLAQHRATLAEQARRSQATARSQASDSSATDLEAARAQLRHSLDFPPPRFDGSRVGKIEEHPLGEDELARYSEWRIPVLPGLHASGIYARPKSARAEERLPLIIAAPGRHGAPAAGAADVRMATRSARDLAWEPLARGFAVWLPTFVFYGPDNDDDFRYRLTMRARQSGTSLLSIEIAKLVRTLDAIEQQRDDIDPARIAMMGFSYGGFYALHTAALEPRIRALIVMGYFNDREAVLRQAEPYGYIDWRFDRSVALWRDPELAALVAPRPFFVQFGTQDPLFAVAGARKAAAEAASRYATVGAADRFEAHEFVAKHEFDTRPAMDFLTRQFGGSSRH
ncbi:alpha/beta hydrolase family protein [Variovorax sp. PBL-H6]|uniref:alpha/beta hydrolase family protein n=1 Tax=Variovorax sp. PBL-H6 TaxID=434009 RepID=UPI0013A5B001|nr:acetylxylan esterase [Variovorax sp. PBL-H6]